MTFPEFCRYAAHYGFTSMPITSDEFAVIAQEPLDTLWGILCDTNAGLPFHRAVAVNRNPFAFGYEGVVEDFDAPLENPLRFLETRYS